MFVNEDPDFCGASCASQYPDYLSIPAVEAHRAMSGEFAVVSTSSGPTDGDDWGLTPVPSPDIPSVATFGPPDSETWESVLPSVAEAGIPPLSVNPGVVIYTKIREGALPSGAASRACDECDFDGAAAV